MAYNMKLLLSRHLKYKVYVVRDYLGYFEKVVAKTNKNTPYVCEKFSRM